MFNKIIYFPLTRILVGLGFVGASVALGGILIQAAVDKLGWNENVNNAVVGIAESLIALFVYIVLFRFYEKRKIQELGTGHFWRNAFLGIISGLALQALSVLVLYLAGGYTITKINPAGYLLPAFIFALTAGFVVEILVQGIFFRITEEKLGTVIALILTSLIFGIAHAGSKAASFYSVSAAMAQAGLLLSASYVYSRSLWLPIFLHFAWDFTVPGILGGLNPGVSVDKTLLTVRIKGPEALTGGPSGTGFSLQATVLCFIVSFIFLRMAQRKGRLIRPYWLN